MQSRAFRAGRSGGGCAGQPSVLSSDSLSLCALGQLPIPKLSHLCSGHVNPPYMCPVFDTAFSLKAKWQRVLGAGTLESQPGGFRKDTESGPASVSPCWVPDAVLGPEALRVNPAASQDCPERQCQGAGAGAGESVPGPGQASAAGSMAPSQWLAFSFSWSLVSHWDHLSLLTSLLMVRGM